MEAKPSAVQLAQQAQQAQHMAPPVLTLVLTPALTLALTPVLTTPVPQLETTSAAPVSPADFQALQMLDHTTPTSPTKPILVLTPT